MKRKWIPFIVAIVWPVFFYQGGYGADFDHSHSAYDRLLKKYVTSGRVNYPGFIKERAAFESYLRTLSSVSMQQYSAWSYRQKLAFLINAYNAFTIKLIIDHYPVRSIKDIGSVLSSPWKLEFFSLLGAKRNLDWIEHGVLRRYFGEPRIHFAIVCASKGCPILKSEAYQADRIFAQLDQSAYLFLNTKSRNYYDPATDTLHVSKIFDWFEEDFKKGGGVRIFIAKYMRNTKISSKTEMEYTDYDWRLNSI